MKSADKKGWLVMNKLGLVLLVLNPLVAIAQARTEVERYSGRMDSHLVPEFSISWTTSLNLTTKRDLAVSKPIGDAKAFEGGLKFLKLPAAETPISVLLLESPTQGARLFVDLDRDGRFSAAEGFAFVPVKQRPNAIGDAVFNLPLPNSPFPLFPVRVRLFRADSSVAGVSKPNTRTVAYSFWAYATGTVSVGNQPIRVWCQFNAETSKVDPRNGIVGMDLDRDGILANPPSPEMAVAKNEAPIFAVGARFLSIERINPEKREVVLRSHPRSDYQRIPVVIGSRLPDFEFRDFDGRIHRLSNFSKKLVLLDFWGTWCGPCISQLPYLKSLSARYRHRGLEMIGINSRDTFAAAKPFIEKHQIDWIQATTESTAELVEKQLRIEVFPTLLLLDSSRRIVLISKGGDDEELSQLLDRMLPKAAPRRP